MANTRGSANVRSYMYPGRHALLPPKSPFPSVSSSYADHIQSPAVGPKVMQKSKDGAHHQRTSSESFLVEEQPSWLDDLLDEPETPVCRQGHRRSSSDSFAYLEAPSLYHVDFGTQDKYMNMTGTPPFWGSQEFDNNNGVQHASLYAEANFSKQKNRVFPSGLPSLKDNKIGHSSASLAAAKEAGNVPFANVNEKKLDITDTCSHVPQASSEKNESSHVKSQTDTKRAKQQFAQRSRVSKLQYIAELEKNVQALQAEGSEVSAEVEFLNQQTLILSMENKALKQRLENIAQEQLIKYMEHKVLERELARLRALYQQQLQQPQPQQRQQQPQQRGSSSHRRSGSKELDSQFANLSLRAKDFNTSHGPVTGPLHL